MLPTDSFGKEQRSVGRRTRSRGHMNATFCSKIAHDPALNIALWSLGCFETGIHQPMLF